jgi:membrane fusion protein, copper/silver efflux system
MGTQTRAVELLRRVAKRAGLRPITLLLVLIGIAVGFWLRGAVAPTIPGASTDSESGEPAEEKAQIWTCSMHPQIRLPNPGLCPICNMELIPLAGDDEGEMAGLRTFTASESAKGLMEIETSEVVRRLVEKDVRMVGKVDFDETKLAYITSWIPGRLDRLYVDYTGVKVRKGDHIVSVYSPELLTAQDELRRAARALETMNPNAPDVLRQTMQSTLIAAREKLRRWGLTDGQIEAAERAESSSDHITIYAPIGGTVIHRNGQEGMYVDTGTRIYTIADLKSVWVKLDAYESDLPWIHYGQNVSFTTESYPGEVFEGKIAFIDPVLDKATRTVKVRVNVSNPDGKLKPEMFVRAVVKSRVAAGGRVVEPAISGKWICPMHPEVIKDGPGKCDICGMALVTTEELGYLPAGAEQDDMPLIVPASAPLITGTRAIVYVRVPNADKPTFEGREIVLGPRAGDVYIVNSGLRQGEHVVTNGNFKIDSALQILAKPSMMTPGGGGGGGHDHGEASQMEAAVAEKNDVVLTIASKGQFGRVGSAYQDVVAAAGSGIGTALTSSLKRLEESLEAVDMAELKGHAHMVWMEYAMRLKNDAAEMQEAKTRDHVTEMAGRLSDNIKELFSKLGLPAPGHAADVTSSSVVPREFQAQLGKIYEAYLIMQDGLATDDAERTREGAEQALQALESVDMTRVAGDLHTEWMNLASELRRALNESVEADSVDAMRSAFIPLSDALWSAADSFGVQSDRPLYQARCPMALDGQGAKWLQADTTIRNPYFGAAMLSCGSIVDKLDPPNDALHESTSHAEGPDRE